MINPEDYQLPNKFIDLFVDVKQAKKFSFDNSKGNQLWLEVGYEVTGGNLADGCEVTLSRSRESSPDFLETHSPTEDLIQFHRFNSDEEQAVWVANAISSNLSDDELRPDDIVVINPDPLSTRDAVGPIRIVQRGILKTQAFRSLSRYLVGFADFLYSALFHPVPFDSRPFRTFWALFGHKSPNGRERMEKAGQS